MNSSSSYSVISGNCDMPVFSAKRPKFLSHQFNMERQNILLLSTKGTSASAILSAQESKIDQFSSFLDYLNLSVNSWNSTVFDGIEMLLRAVQSIKSPSKQNLLLKLYKFKLRILLIRDEFDQEVIEECFNECISNSRLKCIDAFEEYYGIHPQLDSLIGAKILELSQSVSLTETIRTCMELKEKGRNENILKDLLKNVLFAIKTDHSNLRNENLRNGEILFSLMELSVYLFKENFNELSDNLMIIYQSNRQEFLEDSRIFDKFIEIIRISGLKGSPSIVTLFNSRIRSFLNRPEAKRDGVLQSCLKFVLEFHELGIGCIGQFGDFLLKCQLLKLEECSLFTRKLVYKLLRAFNKSHGPFGLKMNTSQDQCIIIDVNTKSSISFLVHDSLKLEFVKEMLNNSDNPDFYLLTIYKEYLDENYFFLLELYLKKIGIIKELYDDFDDFIIYFSDESDTEAVGSGLVETETEGASKDIITGPNVALTEFMNDVLFPIYMKHFKLTIKEAPASDNFLFIKLISIISGLLMNCGKVKWADMSGLFGPNSASLTSNQSSRAIYCKLYTTWIKMNLISTTLRVVLNPRNCAELWVKSLLDFQEYGQVEFFNEYYNHFFTDRIECLKRKMKGTGVLVCFIRFYYDFYDYLFFMVFLQI